jgi:SAM-dependent methyltransferase
MTDKLKALIESLSQTLPFYGPIYEFGSYQTKGQEGFADLRPYFPDTEYIGCDMRPGPGVDMVADLCNCSIKSLTAGSILCLDTLEHCWDPWKAVEEMHRILRDEGFLVVSVPFSHPIHDHPNDYWRFTQEALHVLLRRFGHVETGQSEAGDNPATVAAVAWKKKPWARHSEGVRDILAAWQTAPARRRRTLRSVVRAIAPLGLLNMVRAHYGERIL